MQKNVIIIAFIGLIFSCLAETSVVKKPVGSEFISGYAEGDDWQELEQSALEELAKEISDWWLEKRGLAKKLGYGKKDQHRRMVRVWLNSFKARLKRQETEDPQLKLLYTISADELQKLFTAKYEQIQELIRRGEEGLSYNKLGLFFRYFYWALLEYDLLAGQEIEVDSVNWTNARLVAKINEVAEDFAIKIVGNSYLPGNRRLILQALYNRRPVNDLRIGIQFSEGYRAFSFSDRYLQADMFGFEYENMENLSLSIDIQDKATGVWGEEVQQLGNITGMSGYEAYRTIPLRKVDFEQRSWQDIQIPADDIDERLKANLDELIRAIYYGSPAADSIFASKWAAGDFTRLQQRYNVSLTDLETRVKCTDINGASYWRGFDVIMEYSAGLTAMANLVVKTAGSKITGVWLGMKPLDYRLLERKYDQEQQTCLQAAIEKIEKTYTAAVLGKGRNIEGYPGCPAEGWKWTELEAVQVDVMENGAVYSYRIVLSSKEDSWEFDLHDMESK